MNAAIETIGLNPFSRVCSLAKYRQINTDKHCNKTEISNY